MIHNIKKIVLVLLLAFTGMQVSNKVDGVIVLGAGVATAAVVTAGITLASTAALAGTKIISAVGDVLGSIF